jgi:hypothetical protein
MNKKIVIVIALSVLVVLSLAFFFLRKEPVLVVEPEEEQEKEGKKTEQEKFQEYFVSLVNGKVVSVGENYFTIEIIEQEAGEVEMSQSEFKTRTIRINVTGQTEFVDANDVKFLEIPQEYQDGIAQFNYIKNVAEGDYVLSAYVDLLEDVVSQDQATATYVSWSCYPEEGF